MVFKALKGLFGGSGEPAAPEYPTGPFGLSIGRAIAADTMRLRLEEGRLAMKLPPETLVVTGHGVATLDASGLIHRYYSDDHAMLQTLCVGGISDDCIREITLYHLWDEFVPGSPAEWAAWDGQGGRIGAATFEAEGLRFERVWGEASTAWVAPAEFTEEVIDNEGGRKTIHQKIMPYRREIGPLVETLLIAVERDIASSDRGSITFMVGYGLARADVTPI